jgi:Na+/proline symporter
MNTLNIVLIVLAAVLGIGWYTRRRNRINRDRDMKR